MTFINNAINFVNIRPLLSYTICLTCTYIGLITCANIITPPRPRKKSFSTATCYKMKGPF